MRHQSLNNSESPSENSEMKDLSGNSGDFIEDVLQEIRSKQYQETELLRTQNLNFQKLKNQTSETAFTSEGHMKIENEGKRSNCSCGCSIL